ncbi:MAG: VOC family protein [Dehalococcoidia bacterium]
MSDDWARPLVHWAIEARDPANIRDFYAAMFNWTFSDGPVMQAPAGLGAPEGGVAGHIQQGAHSRVILYFQVKDLRASLTKAVEFGGAVTREPFDIPNGPTIAFITDPEGNPVSLVQQ